MFLLWSEGDAVARGLSPPWQVAGVAVDTLVGARTLLVAMTLAACIGVVRLRDRATASGLLVVMLLLASVEVAVRWLSPNDALL